MCCLLHDGCLNGLIIELEDGGGMLTFIGLDIVDKWILGFRRISWGLVVVSAAGLGTTNGLGWRGSTEIFVRRISSAGSRRVCETKITCYLPTIIK